MSYTLEDVSGCSKKIVFQIGEVDISSDLNTALEQKRKSVSLKGFRKGKAPLPVVDQLYGKEIEGQILQKFISNKLFEALQKEKIKAVAPPLFQSFEYKADEKEVHFVAIVEHLPLLQIKDVSHLSFTRGNASVSDDKVNEAIRNQLDGRAEMVEVSDGVLEKGHHAVINFEGRDTDGQEIENAKGEEFLLEIGSNAFIPGFEDGLVGMKAGETRDITLKFPSNYHQEKLKDADVIFTVELLEIKTKKIPELTDDVAKELDFKSKEEMEKLTRQRLTYEQERKVKEKLHQDILNKLIEENSFDVPQSVLDEQEKAVQENLSRAMTAQKMSDAQVKQYFQKWGDEVKKKALFQVRTGLILQQLGEDYSIKVTQEDLDEKYKEMAMQSQMSFEEVREHYAKNEEVVKNLRYALREEKCFEEICRRANVTIES